MSTKIEQFEQQHNVILFDDERILQLSEREISAIDALNQVDAFNIHSMQILSDISPLLDALSADNHERMFFEQLISTILNCYIEDRASSVIIQ